MFYNYLKIFFAIKTKQTNLNLQYNRCDKIFLKRLCDFDNLHGPTYFYEIKMSYFKLVFSPPITIIVMKRTQQSLKVVLTCLVI
jgi:hypothetical protein